MVYREEEKSAQFISLLQLWFIAAFSSGLSAFKENWKPDQDASHGPCWFRRSLVLTGHFNLFWGFIETCNLSFSYFRRCDFIFLWYYSEILVILQTRSPPPFVKPLLFVLESSECVTTPSYALFLRKETCDTHCVVSCLALRSHPGCFCSEVPWASKHYLALH